jgi:hypothetical protein
MVRLILLALAGALALALAGCARSAPAGDPELTIRWLNGVPCRPPCWEGITPGTTTYTEAFRLLLDNKFVDPDQVDGSPAADRIEWTWVDQKYGGWLSTSGVTVSWLLVELPHEVLLRDVVAAYGEPSHIAASWHFGVDSSAYSLAFVWESAGFALDSGIAYQKAPALGPDLALHKLYFSAEPTVIMPTVWGKLTLLPWEGFKDFDAYCRDEAGHPCPKR